MEKEILVLIENRLISMLIPKKRGQGFLKTPLGHHNCPLAQLSRDIDYDMFGLDGSLDVPVKWIDSSNKDQFIEEIIKPVSDFFGVAYRIVKSDEYWENHPIGKKNLTEM